MSSSRYLKSKYDGLTSRSNIDITQRSVQGVHDIPNLDLVCKLPQVNNIVERSVSARRAVEQCEGSGNRVQAVLRVLALPDPPSTVNLRMVQEEEWVLQWKR